jgi:hypothetical protein
MNVPGAEVCGVGVVFGIVVGLAEVGALIGQLNRLQFIE